MFGYAGKILHIDLMRGAIEEQETPEKLAREFNQMLDEYYGIRGWDTEGRPKREKLEELGIPKLLEG